MPEFVHLHIHTEYSLLDGACRIDRLIERVKALGQKAVAVTDHGVMYGVIDFYKAAKKAGIKPIIGCEVYTAARTRFDKSFDLDSEIGHLVLLARSEEGYRNLMAMVSDAFMEGFYSKPRVDFELLTRHSGGLIALSACLAGQVQQLLIKENYEGAKAMALKYREIFGEYYYLELQDHGLKEQAGVNRGLIRISRETGIPLVVTNDAHYVEKKDADVQRVLMCIQMGKTVDDGDPYGFETQEFYVKSAEEMAALFPEHPEALLNTVKIAELCNVEFDFSQHHLPRFDVPEGRKPAEYLRELCLAGYARRFGEGTPELMERLNYELSVIEKMGYIDYFLIVQDFIRFAKDSGIPVGPGRGSAAGSLVSYCLTITDIDPVRYNLLFERFLNPERVSMPDIDIDFCFERRQEVIDYVVRKYGADRVAQIVTFGTLAARAAIRDVGRALSVPYAQVDMIAKQVPMELHMTLSRALEVSAPLRESYENDPLVKRLIDTARELEGMPRHASTHAAGVVITREPVKHYVPLARNEDAAVTQFTMGTLEELGLLKMDFLGLRNLTVIRAAEEMIRRCEPDFDVAAVDPEDPRVYELLSSGQTAGVFQLESAGMKQVLTGLRPTNFEDIIAVISLYRPGPMESIPRYIDSRHHPERIRYKHPLLEEILNVTYGCILYQEQVMQIVRKLAGYSYGRADLVRRAMSKKKAEVMERERKSFLHGEQRPDGSWECEGAVRRGVPEAVATDIFDEMTAFASYAFNKSHAAAYAVVAFRTAFLKAVYPREYFAALLTSVLDSTDKVTEYIGECARLHIRVLPPDINESGVGFTVSGKDIRFGLVAIKNIGRGLIERVIAERESGGRFESFDSFFERMGDGELNKKAVESLIESGALDGFGLRRSQMLAVYDRLMDAVSSTRRRNLEGQMDLFGDGGQPSPATVYPDLPELPIRDRLNREKAVTGLYLSGHPLKEYEADIRRIGGVPIREISALTEEDAETTVKDGDLVTVAGVVISRKNKTTKNDSLMAFVGLEDMTGSLELIVFPKVLERCDRLLVADSAVAVRGRVSVREDEPAKLVCEDALALSEAGKGFAPPPRRWAERREAPSPSVSMPQAADPGPAPPAFSEGKKLYLRVPSRDCEALKRALKFTDVLEGDTPLCIYCEDTGKLMQAKRERWVEPAPVLIRELKRLLGEENVKLR